MNDIYQYINLKLTDLPYLSSKRLEALNAQGITSIGDLLDFFPRRYLDRTTVLPIRNLNGKGEEVTVVGRVKKIQVAGSGRKKRLEVIIQDDTASMKGVWFKGVSYVKRLFKEQELVAFFGKAKRYGSYISMAHPEMDKIGNPEELRDLSRIVPVYPGSKAFSKVRINSRLIHQWMETILDETRPPEFLPQEIMDRLGLPGRYAAYRAIHFPESTADHQRALKRFKFEELFLFQLSVNRVKKTVIDKYDGPLLKQTSNFTRQFFNEVLPFELTSGQKSALGDIKKDVRSGSQMNRLIQGDVGSGKTVVAIGAMLMALDNDYQAALMAPTEILAEQHYRTLSDFLESMDINIRLLTGQQSTGLRTDILTDIEGGNAQIVVGTHAVIQDEVRFNRLGLAVIDEQHRFGVKQRAEMLRKGSHPHVLVMSATPIPRSLAMTLYSDLDVSVIKGLPAGRKPVKTAVRPETSRKDIYKFIGTNLEEGGQAYIVYPLVEESEKIDLKDATAGYENIKSKFPDYEVALLHGRMKTDKKDAIMRKFIANEVQILVTTTVIEVGVDVPNANIMMVEHAERFGLSQLHQLRGRIGRGNRKSYCILVHDRKLSNEARFRLRTMSETGDGFKIAEADLKLRGPGDFLGTKQSGLPEFKVADIVEDQWILEQAKSEAASLIKDDPDLDEPQHQELKKVFIPYYKEKSQFYGLG